MRVLRGVHSFLSWAVALLATAVFGAAAVCSAVVSPSCRLPLRITRLWARLCLAVTGCRLRVHGLDRLDPSRRYVLMVNHQSALDIPVLLAVVPVELCITFWAKRSLFRLPFLGWAMSAMGFIPVDRVNRGTAAGMFALSLARVERGRSLLVFPEETYAPEVGALPFQRGGFLLALKANLPILPVAITGTRAALPPNGRTVRPSVIDVRFGKPIETDDIGVSDRRELTDRTRRSIAELVRGTG